MTKEEQLKLQLSTVLDEYRALKSEIVANLVSARGVASLTLTAVGILIAASPFIIQSKTIIIFLIAPFLFYILAWTQLRYIYLVLDMGAYLKDVVVPNIHRILVETTTPEILDKTTPDKKHSIEYIMSWELPGKGPSRLRSGRLLRILFLPIAGANFGIPLLVAILSPVTFIILAIHSSHAISSIERILIGVGVVAFLYSVFWGYQAERLR